MNRTLTAALFTLLCLSPAPAEESFRSWNTARGLKFDAKFISADADKVTVKKKDGKTVTIPRDELLPLDARYVEGVEKGGSAPAPSTTPSRPSPAPVPAPGGGQTPPPPSPSAGGDDTPDDIPGEPEKGKLYPRAKDEIRSTLRTILARDKPKDLASKEVWEAICRLNAHRYLAGVSWNVGTQPNMNDGAQDASVACAKAGTISHSLGHSTDKCNLSMGRSDMASTVNGYIDDGGDNNRAARGHRRWCLNPPMQNAGFGREGIFSAMWCMDSGGTKTRDFWTWPGRGLFPLEYFSGNSWSFYSPGSLPAETKVRMWKLHGRPQQSIPWGEEPKGKEIEIGYTHQYDNTINFEPDPKYLGRRGVFWVRVQGRGLREQYVVEMF
jgi:SLA1 homology domain 1, SHD1